MAHPMRVSPWSEGKPPQAVRQASSTPTSGPSLARDDETIRMSVGPLLLTAEQAAYALSICRTKVYELMRTGQLESVQIGASRRVPVAALDEYVERLRGSSELHEQVRGRADRSASEDP